MPLLQLSTVAAVAVAGVNAFAVAAALAAAAVAVGCLIGRVCVVVVVVSIVLGMLQLYYSCYDYRSCFGLLIIIVVISVLWPL